MVSTRLAERPLQWDIESRELALITGEGSGISVTYTLVRRYPLHG
jgi:hypothetical protein